MKQEGTMHAMLFYRPRLKTFDTQGLENKIILPFLHIHLLYDVLNFKNTNLSTMVLKCIFQSYLIKIMKFLHFVRRLNFLIIIMQHLNRMK